MLAVVARDRLFHVLVVLGAGAVTNAACSGNDTGASQPPQGDGGAADARDDEPKEAATPSVGDVGELPEASPVPDCDHAQQLSCAIYGPPRDCSCNLSAPLDPADCQPGLDFTCALYDPPTGCDCVYHTGPR